MAISHKALFEKLRDTSVIEKCVQYAHWTLPQLMADVSEHKGRPAVVERDYQEMGALLVNHLATKLTRLEFPTNQPFFFVELAESLRKEAQQGGLSDQDLQSGIAKMEQDSCKRLFMNASYAQLILALKHLIVTGNVLIHRDSDNAKITAYGIQSFGIKRDGRGTLLDLSLIHI